MADGSDVPGDPPTTSPAPALPVAVQPVELAGLPLFEGVEPVVVETLAPTFAAVHYRNGSSLLQAGDRPSKLQIIERGIVELCRTDSHGHEFGVLLLSEKDLLMPAAALFEEPSLVCARALTTVRILEIESELIQVAVAHSPHLAVNLMKAVSGQWRMAVRGILDLTSRDAAQRLASFLLRLADLQRGESSAALPISKRNLAKRLAMTPETLSRALQIIADHGLHLRGRTIIVHDRSRIEEFCGPDPYPARDERQLNVFAL